MMLKYSIPLWVLMSIGVAQGKNGADLELLSAVQTTLVKEPGIAVERQNLIAANAALQSAESVFDTTLSLEAGYSRTDTPLDSISRAAYQNTVDSSIADSRTLHLGLAKTFKQGLMLTPGLQISRAESLLAGGDEPVAVPPITNRASLSISFVQPILRGAGSVAVAGQARAAQYNAVAAQADFEFLLSQKVLTTTRAFWAYYAAYERVGMLKKTEKRAEQLTRETQILIDAAEWPAADIQQTKASLAQKKKDRIRAEQAFLAARHRLAMAMGLDFESFSSLGHAAKRYPKIVLDTKGLLEQAETMAAEALKNRRDYQAQSFRQKSAQTLAASAQRNRLPELNLTGSLGYSGLEQGAKSIRFGESVYKNIPGANGALNLVFNWPIENKYYDAVYLQARSAATQSAINLKDLERNIRSEVKLAIAEVISSAAEVEAADFSAKSFEIAVTNEKKKLKAGLSTLIDLIQMENNAIAARLSWIGAQENYANALAALRYNMGSLIVIGDGAGHVTWDTLTTIPIVEE